MYFILLLGTYEFRGLWFSGFEAVKVASGVWSQRCLYHIAAQRKYTVLVKWTWTSYINSCQRSHFSPCGCTRFPFRGISFISAAHRSSSNSILPLFPSTLDRFFGRCLLLYHYLQFVFLPQTMLYRSVYLYCIINVSQGHLYLPKPWKNQTFK